MGRCQGSVGATTRGPSGTACGRTAHSATATPGLATLACDGVTILGKSYLLYTIAKGQYVLFEGLQHLKSKSHVTEAEVEDGAKKIECALIKLKDNGGVANLAVDNAAREIARSACQRIVIKLPGYPPILVTRDPAHCLDLPAKDTTVATFLKDIMEQAKGIIKFVNTDNIDSVLDGMVSVGALSPR